MAALPALMNVGRILGAMSVASTMALFACSSQTGTGGSGDNGDGEGCTLVGCNSSVSAALSTTLAEGEVAKAKVIACRNDECTEGSLGMSSGTINGSRFYVCSFASATRINGPSCEGDSIGSLVFKFGLDDGAAKDGDRYSFKVVVNGEVKGEKSGAVTYKTAQPNGPSCGPTCSQAEM